MPGAAQRQRAGRAVLRPIAGSWIGRHPLARDGCALIGYVALRSHAFYTAVLGHSLRFWRDIPAGTDLRFDIVSPVMADSAGLAVGHGYAPEYSLLVHPSCRHKRRTDGCGGRVWSNLHVYRAKNEAQTKLRSSVAACRS